jgi:methyl-accepting chemotaxis protein
VRLFRTLRFAAKAVIISLAFVLPLLGLLGWQLRCRPDGHAGAQDATRQHVEVAHGIVCLGARPGNRRQADREAGAAAGAQAIAGLRYDGATSTSGSTTCSRAWSCTRSSPSSTARTSAT